MGHYLRRILLIFPLIIANTSVNAFEFSLATGVTFVSGDDEQKNFAIGQVELLAEHNISDKTYAVVDVMFDSTRYETETEIERLSVNRVVNDSFQFGVGRYTKPLGFWNHNFSHGSLSQHTVSRPYLIDIEEEDKGFLPSHLVGLLLRGESDSWTYQFAVANTDAIDSSNAAMGSGSAVVFPLNNESPGDDLTLLFRTTFLATDNLEFGLTLGSHNFTETGGSGLVAENEVLFEQSYAALDFNFNTKSFYMFGEYYFVQFDDNPDIVSSPPAIVQANPDTYDATAYYLQLGFRATETLTLVTRYESLEFDDNATIMVVQNIVPQNQTVVGFNYALEQSNAIRFEVKDVEPEVGESDTIYSLQWFFFLL